MALSDRAAKNWSNTVLYCEQLERGQRAIEWREELPALKRAGETAAFGLRMNSGWAFDPFRDTTGFDLQLEWKPEMDQLIERGWGSVDGSGFRLTPQGLRFADAAAELFLSNQEGALQIRKVASGEACYTSASIH